MSKRNIEWEVDREAFPAQAYKEKRYPGVAWHVLGWETEADEDTEWTGIQERTGRVVARMIGDDRYFTFDKEDLIPLGELEYCAECGQIGCTHDGRERSVEA